jgi:hypothetical protein
VSKVVRGGEPGGTRHRPSPHQRGERPVSLVSAGDLNPQKGYAARRQASKSTTRGERCSNWRTSGPPLLLSMAGNLPTNRKHSQLSRFEQIPSHRTGSPQERTAAAGADADRATPEYTCRTRALELAPRRQECLRRRTLPAPMRAGQSEQV